MNSLKDISTRRSCVQFGRHAHRMQVVEVIMEAKQRLHCYVRRTLRHLLPPTATDLLQRNERIHRALNASYCRYT